MVDFVYRPERNLEVVKQVTEVESRMVEVSEEKVLEKAQEIHAKWVEEFRKSNEDAEAKSLLHDPFALLDSLKYKERPMMLTYEVLRAMSERNPIIASVINTRVNQVSAFSSPPRSPYDIGFRVHMKDDEMKPTPDDEKRINEIETMIENTGVVSLPTEERDDFDTYLRKITRDTLTYDQLAFEVLNGRGKTPVAFLGIDAATIRLASTAKYFKNIKHMRGFALPPTIETEMGSIQKEQIKPEDIKYVQIIDGKVVTTYTEQEMGFGIRNPRTNIKQNGYGVSELEILVNTVTAHLWAEEYNRRFFCAGLSVLIDTNLGVCKLGELVNKEFKIWNGNSWSKAKAFETGIRPKVRTKLWNGLELETSPEHRFFIVSKNSFDGIPEWKEQKDLEIGDYAFIGYKNQDFDINYSLLKIGNKYKNRKNTEEVKYYERKIGSRLLRVEGFNRREKFEYVYNYNFWSPSKELVNDEEFWEMIGFALGDGHWYESRLDIYPHHTKEISIRKRFLEICKKYNITAEEFVGNPGKERIDGNYGYPYIKILHDGLMLWLYDIGFKTSSEGKRIPMIFFQLPSFIRCAILRGLFDADGCCSQVKHNLPIPGICAIDKNFRQDILNCLWSVGVGAHENGKGFDRSYTSHGGSIGIQDIEAFKERIGFIQERKNKNILDRSNKSKYKWDSLNLALSRTLAIQIMKNENYSVMGNNQWKKSECKIATQDKAVIQKAALGKTKIGRKRIIDIMNKLEMTIPDYLNYIQVPIDCLDREPIGYEPMGDIEVFDDKHMFLANFMAVHNSQGSAPKGIIHFEGNVDQTQLTAFRRQWHAQVMGVFNAWRTPIISAPAKLQYTNLQMSNRQMEFSNWIDYLIKIVCAVYLIDPAEIGFEMRGGATSTQPPAFETHAESRQKMSKDRGLRPLLKFIQSEMNKNVIYRLYDGRYEFEFVGLDTKTEEQLQDMHLKEVQNFKVVDEIRAEYDLPPLGHDRGGDIIMNSAYLGYLNQLQMQKLQMGPEGGAEDFGKEPQDGEEQKDFGEEVDTGEGEE